MILSLSFTIIMLSVFPAESCNTKWTGNCHSNCRDYCRSSSYCDLDAEQRDKWVWQSRYCLNDKKKRCRCKVVQQDFRNYIKFFNDKLDGVSQEDPTMWLATTRSGERVFQSFIQGNVHNFIDSPQTTDDTAFPLFSVSKCFTGLAAMVTFERLPNLFRPDMKVYEFQGWENFRNLKDRETGEVVGHKMTIHDLLIHTNGLPFRAKTVGLTVWGEDDIKDLNFKELTHVPGEKYSYTIGHRVVAWILRDIWTKQRVPKKLGLKTVNDVFRWLIFDPLDLSDKTKFDDDSLHWVFNGEAGDATMVGTAADLEKVVALALRKGELPSKGAAPFTLMSQNYFCNNRGSYAALDSRYSAKVADINACSRFVENNELCGEFFNFGTHDGFCDCVPIGATCGETAFNTYNTYQRKTDYGKFAEGRVPKNEGSHLGSVAFTHVGDCQAWCDENTDCNSFARCDDNKHCWFKKKVLTGKEESRNIGRCTTYFKQTHYGKFAEGSVPKIEGSHIGAVAFTNVDDCQAWCNGRSDCNSFARCDDNKHCWFKSKVLTGKEESRNIGRCTTYFKSNFDERKYLVSAENWEKWAMPNLLPGKKTTKELKFNSEFGDVPGASGNFGYNYFGGVYQENGLGVYTPGGRRSVGWCGAMKTCIFAEYSSRIGFVIMRKVLDPLHMVAPDFSSYISNIAKQLTCPPSQRKECVMCSRNDVTRPFDKECPNQVVRWKWSWEKETFNDQTHHTCFNPNACYN